MAVSPVPKELTMKLLDLVIPKWVQIVAPIVLGAFLVLGIWAGVSHYNSVVAERDRLSTQVKQLNKSIVVLEENTKATVERQKDMTDIKREIHEIPSSSLPADIQRTFDRLRDRH